MMLLVDDFPEPLPIGQVTFKAAHPARKYTCPGQPDRTFSIVRV